MADASLMADARRRAPRVRPHRSPATHPPTCSPAHVACGRRECVSAAGHPPHSHLPAQPSAAAARQVGDASASQSPLSFGGFGTMLRHLPRLAAGVDSALATDALSRRALAVLQARPVSGQGMQHALLLRGSSAARERSRPTGPRPRSGRRRSDAPCRGMVGLGHTGSHGTERRALQALLAGPAGAACGQSCERPPEQRKRHAASSLACSPSRAHTWRALRRPWYAAGAAAVPAVAVGRLAVPALHGAARGPAEGAARAPRRRQRLPAAQSRQHAPRRKLPGDAGAAPGLARGPRQGH